MKKEKREQHFIKKPYYEGGMSAMKIFIKQHLSYPELAKTNKVEGMVYVRYTINYKGNVINAKIITGIGYGCDEEAARLVKLLKFKVPKNRNLKAVFHKNLQIHFRLSEVKTPKLNLASPPSTNLQYYYTKAPKVAVEQKKKKLGYTIVIKQQ